MAIIKSEGVTTTEKLLARLCEQSFLKLWSYPNPFKDDKKELCDLLAVFENHVFIFFDRENLTLSDGNTDMLVGWKRWKKKVIDAQTRTAHGAERYIKNGGDIFLDKDLLVPFPINIDPQKMIVHKIIIAHGAKEACKKFSNDNIYGSLGISYGDTETEHPYPFMIRISKENPVHIFDSHNLPIIFSELDTFYDLSSYLDAKIDAIKSLDLLIYCGEEDVLAHYFLSFNETQKKHFIGISEESINSLIIEEGEWKNFTELEIYKNKKSVDKISYFWDDIIQRTCENTLNGTILGSTPLRGQSAIHEMAKEPRFSRRALSEQMIKAIKQFPESSQRFMRNLSFMPSFYKETGYVFLQLKVDGITDYENDYRPIRQEMLEIACGATRNRFSHLKTIVGIAIDAPKFAKTNSEDLILLDCSNWTDEKRKHYEKANEVIGFYKSNKLTIQKKSITEFPSLKKSENSTWLKIGRNSPCPCGSGKKYKKCCIDVEIT